MLGALEAWHRGMEGREKRRPTLAPLRRRGRPSARVPASPGSLGTPPLPLATLSLCLPFLSSCLHGPGTGSYSQDPPSCTTEPSPCGAQTENMYVP